DLFDELNAGDFLFIDSSHRTFKNSDVTVVFLEILPRLKPGVLVHFHDIFLPNDYPEEWETRYYYEQYILAASLLAKGSRLDTVFPSLFILQHPRLSTQLHDIWEAIGAKGISSSGGSFWLRINE